MRLIIYFPFFIHTSFITRHENLDSRHATPWKPSAFPYGTFASHPASCAMEGFLWIFTSCRLIAVQVTVYGHSRLAIRRAPPSCLENEQFFSYYCTHRLREVSCSCWLEFSASFLRRRCENFRTFWYRIYRVWCAVEVEWMCAWNYCGRRSIANHGETWLFRILNIPGKEGMWEHIYFKFPKTTRHFNHNYIKSSIWDGRDFFCRLSVKEVYFWKFDFAHLY